MVGLKTFWIFIFSLFVFVSCVPQTKQTECAGNEAFNASLRTCVPVVGGPSSFINIESYSPMFTQTRSKADQTPISFSITVSNPYNQSYSVEWERVFNAAPTYMCSNTLTCSFSGYLLGTVYGQVGTHIITAKIKDGYGKVVDTHSFELKINELPKPVIGLPITPATYAFDKLPTDPRVEFSFVIRNNDATIVASDNYRTIWSIQKNGSTIYTETDVFTNLTPTGTHATYLGTAATPYFNPATLGVGSYVIRARVQNDVPGEIVGEQQWSVIVKQPDLANVTIISLPAPGVTTTAHHGVSYNSYPTLSWIYGSPASQPNFCVTVDDRDGTYAGDGKSIQVKWYLDSIGGEICTKKTLDTPGTQTICLVDANNCEGSGAPFDTTLLLFINATPSAPQTHKVTARLFDEATTFEFERTDVIPSNGSYPIEWPVSVQPVNSAPKLSFGSAATNPTGCVSAGGFTRSNCQVTQGSNFTVSFSVSDDFYSAATQPNEFQWDIKLKRDGGDLTTPDVSMNTSCTKAFGGAPAPAAKVTGYGTEWTCSLNVPHYTSAGPLNPETSAFQVVLTAQDSGSPVGGTGQVAQSLSWNLVVTEANPAAPGIVLNPQTVLVANSNITKGITVMDPADTNSFATELETILFRMHVTDPELDDFKYRISLCTDNTATCSSSIVLTVPAYMDFLRASQTVPSTNPVLASGILYTLPEDLLIGKHSTSIDIDTVTSHKVYFKVDVVDVPSILTTPVRSDSEIFSLYVRNYNPAPVINTAAAIPAVGSTTVVQSGYQLTIDPGSVTDASVPAVEKNLQYQWYAKIGAGAWTAISGATSRILRYTPGNITSTIDLKMCVGDGTAANPVSSTGTCTASWFITPKQYLHNLTATGANSVQNEVAIWYDSTNTVPNTQVIYSAYVDSANNIFVEKTIKDTTGNIVLTTNTIQFTALAAGVLDQVSNLSIAGSDDSIYIAYIASVASAPGTFVPRVRRINKDFDLVAPAMAKNNLSHPAPFGFNYLHYALACSNAANCTTTVGNGIGGPATITFANRLATADTITVAGEIFTAGPTPVGPNDICDASACADVASMAVNVRDKINNSTLALLHGIVARAAGATVELYGQYDSDYLDFDGSIAGVPGLVVGQQGLGKIFVHGGKWHLPMINGSLSGSEQNNITVLSGNADMHLRSAGLALNTGDVLTEMGKTAYFDAKLNQNGELVIARISADLTDAGALSLYRYTLSGADWSIFDTTGGLATDQSDMDIFGTYSFEYVRLATDNTSNPYYYVIAREKTINGAEYHIGRYDKDLQSSAAVSENFLTSKVVTSDATDDMITDAKIKFPDLVSIPGYAEARIFFHSVGTGAVPYPRLAKWKTDDTVTCGTCFSLSGSLEYQSTSRIGISQIAPDITLGTAGASAGENVNDVVFALFSSDVNNDDVFKPQMAIINVESEPIQSTSVEATGLFQPPFVLDQ